MKKALITGISGFAGSFLVDYVLSLPDYVVSGTYFTKSSLENISQKDNLSLLQIDLTDQAAVDKMIEDLKPDMIFHLAALTSPAQSFKDPVKTFTNNVISQMYIFEALKKYQLLHTKTLVVSSAEIYGKVEKEDLPIDEETPLRPVSPYAVSKLAQDFLGLQYHLAYGFPIVRVRPFNHIGPKQSPHFAIAGFCKKIAQIEKGILPPRLPVGNRDAKRDFTDVRDMVIAYHMLLEKGEAGEVYNLGSGNSYKISDILDILLSFSKVSIDVFVDSSLLRPIDNPELVCNNRKMVDLTGWKPAISLEQSLKDTLSYWRSHV